jgi:hypothetical protein
MGLLVWASVSSPAYADGKLSEKERLYNVVMSGSEDGEFDTTTLREEFKATLRPKHARKIEQRMLDMGARLRGKKEWQDQETSTDYVEFDHDILTNIVNVPEAEEQPEHTITTKGRKREYEHLRGKVFVEVKMSHPEFDGVTLKPRILATKKQAKRLFNPKYMAKKSNRAAITKALMKTSGKLDTPDEAKTRKLVEAMVGTIHETLEEEGGYSGTKKRVDTRVNIKYRRTAYEFPLRLYGKDLDLQVTFDRDIRMTGPDGKEMRMRKGAMTVETKIPVPYSTWTIAETLKELGKARAALAKTRRGTKKRREAKATVEGLQFLVRFKNARTNEYDEYERAAKDEVARLKAEYGDDKTKKQKRRIKAAEKVVRDIKKLRRLDGDKKSITERRDKRFQIWKGKHFTFLKEKRNLKRVRSRSSAPRDSEDDADEATSEEGGDDAAEIAAEPTIPKKLRLPKSLKLPKPRFSFLSKILPGRRRQAKEASLAKSINEVTRSAMAYKDLMRPSPEGPVKRDRRRGSRRGRARGR